MNERKRKTLTELLDSTPECEVVAVSENGIRTVKQTPKKEWVGLTDDEVSAILDREIGFNSCWGPETDFARAIEAKLKEKNT